VGGLNAFHGGLKKGGDSEINFDSNGKSLGKRVGTGGATPGRGKSQMGWKTLDGGRLMGSVSRPSGVKKGGKSMNRLANYGRNLGKQEIWAPN